MDKDFYLPLFLGLAVIVVGGLFLNNSGPIGNLSVDLSKSEARGDIDCGTHFDHDGNSGWTMCAASLDYCVSWNCSVDSFTPTCPQCREAYTECNDRCDRGGGVIKIRPLRVLTPNR